MEYNAQEICARSRNRKTSVIIQLLDKNYNVADEIQGDVTNGSITIKNSIDSNFSRRNGNMDLLLTKPLSEQYYKIDLAHKVRILVNVVDLTTSISATYNKGIFLLSNPQISQAVGSEKITVSLLDLMADFDGTFGKSVDASMTAKVLSGSNISSEIQAVATSPSMMNLPIDRIKIEHTDLVTIEEISTSPESNITDHLKSIIDDTINYDLYFDNDGILVFEYIKNRDTDPITQEFINSDVIISYEIDEDFTNVRNVVNIVGATINGTLITGQHKETNSNNPLNINGKYGERPITLSFDKLQTTDQCNSQAKYECSKRTNYKEKLQISLMPDYRLEPNQKIKVYYDSYADNLHIDGYYLIDEISMDLKPEGIMTIVCHKLYPTT